MGEPRAAGRKLNERAAQLLAEMAGSVCVVRLLEPTGVGWIASWGNLSLREAVLFLKQQRPQTPDNRRLTITAYPGLHTAQRQDITLSDADTASLIDHVV